MLPDMIPHIGQEKRASQEILDIPFYLVARFDFVFSASGEV